MTLDGNSRKEHGGRVTEISKTGLTDTAGVSIIPVAGIVSTPSVSIQAYLTRLPCQGQLRFARARVRARERGARGARDKRFKGFISSPQAHGAVRRANIKLTPTLVDGVERNSIKAGHVPSALTGNNNPLLVF